MEKAENNSGFNARQELLRRLPGVDSMLGTAAEDPDLADVPATVLKRCVRQVIEGLRAAILETGQPPSGQDLSRDSIFALIKSRARTAMAQNLVHVINATGVVVHTNLGRSLLSPRALERVSAAASGYSNLEFNLETGRRGSRYEIVEELICEISGAEAAMAVNNNAGAVLLCLDTLAKE
ncbi:MAG: L-seryl-tRNA(Sec) selenium transferase, partial [Desulfosalsimonas sp.]